MGDGAPWIRAGVNHFNRNQAQFALDKFHLQQSITRMTRDKEIRNLLNSYIYANKREDFNTLTKNILENAGEDKEEKVLDQIKYIKNNWNAIQLMNNEIVIGCGMEGTISHTLASVFTSVPKGYNIDNLKKYINNRMLYLNGYDLRKIFLSTYDKKEEVVTDLPPISYAMFDERASIDKATTSNFIKSLYWKS